MSKHVLLADVDRLLRGGSLSGENLKQVLRHLTDCMECSSRQVRSRTRHPKRNRTQTPPPTPWTAEVSHLEGAERVELLLQASFGLRYRNSKDMIELAEMARDAMEQLAGPQDETALADLRARVWAELGNAYRVGDDLFAADEALEAITHGRRGSGNLQIATRIADLAASLFGDQRRLGEACAVLNTLQRIHEEREDANLAGRAQIKKSLVLGYGGEPEQGIAVACDALARIDLLGDPKLALSALHALVYNLVEARKYSRARTLLWQIRPLYERDGDALNLVRYRWLDGKVCAGMGQDRAAEEHFQAARKKFKAYRQHYDWALVSLDLAMLWSRQGRREEACGLAQTLIASFRSLRIAREAIASLLVFCNLSRRTYVPDDLLLDQLESTSSLLKELDRQPPRRRG